MTHSGLLFRKCWIWTRVNRNRLQTVDWSPVTFLKISRNKGQRVKRYPAYNLPYPWTKRMLSMYWWPRPCQQATVKTNACNVLAAFPNFPTTCYIFQPPTAACLWEPLTLRPVNVTRTAVRISIGYSLTNKFSIHAEWFVFMLFRAVCAHSWAGVASNSL